MSAALKLLVVEDQPEINNALSTYARNKGYEVISADDGLQALDLGLRERPDVVLLDISLPGLDGRDILKRWRSEGFSQDAVVIFLTARDEQSDRLLGLELGADDYETKPVHFNMLFTKIQRLLEKKRSEVLASK